MFVAISVVIVRGFAFNVDIVAVDVTARVFVEIVEPINDEKLINCEPIVDTFSVDTVNVEFTTCVFVKIVEPDKVEFTICVFVIIVEPIKDE